MKTAKLPQPTSRPEMKSAASLALQETRRRLVETNRAAVVQAKQIDEQREQISTGINALRAINDPAVIDAASPQSHEALVAGARIILDSMAQAAETIERATLTLEQRQAG